MNKLYETDYVLVDNNKNPIDFSKHAWLVYGDLEEVKEDAKKCHCNYIAMTKLSKHWQDKYIKYFKENDNDR
jgi:hypothetical protein